MYDQLGAHVGLTGPQVQQLLEDQVRRNIAAQQQQTVTDAETRMRQAHLHTERQDIVNDTLSRMEEAVGQFDAGDAWAEAQQIVAENPDLAADPQSMQAVLYQAAERSAEQIAEGNARIDQLINRANRIIGADPDRVRAAADRAFDPTAPDQGAEIARAIYEGFTSAPTPVRFGTRVTDTYAEMQRLHRELADTTPPREERQVQLRLRDQQGRFTNVERVTDRYRRESFEAEQEQKRLAAHQNLMRSKGLL
ncbi:MAG TPA: hypothetical protein VFW41_11825 [Gaiellaceae bacterium]|nr:hypothetical protein [Gaiellaceae bacterium]